MSELITVIFDANGGGITVSSKRVTVGEPYGELPMPSRFGYEFNGWFTDEQDGEQITEESIVTVDSSHALYAHWTKNARSDEKLKAYKKKKAAVKRQKIIIAVSVVLAVLAIAGLFVVMHIVNRTNLEDVDGTVYKIIKKDGTYILCDADENKLKMTEDGKFYVTAAGSQIRLDAESGKASIYAYVDTVGSEVVGNVVTARILAFPQVERKEMTRLEIHNNFGTYAFCGTHKNGTNKYYIEGHESTAYNQEQFASLVVSCGYVLAMSKIENPVADENGEYSEYGLVSETRTDYKGEEYTYTPAWYKMSDIYGNTYTVIIGDAIVSGGGYYIQYLNPDYPDTPFIYIVSTEIEKTVLQPVETMVDPMISYPMTISNYFNVENFTLVNSASDSIVSFSFVPIEERLGTMRANSPYVFLTKDMKNLQAHPTNVDSCLQSFVNMEFVGVVKIDPTDEDFIRYGVADCQYVLAYDYMIKENNEKNKVAHSFLISKMTERGTYYIYSGLTDMIVEVERRFVPFLEYKIEDWVDDSAYSLNIGCTDEILLQNGSSTIDFLLDNTDTDQYEYTPLQHDNYSSTGFYGDTVTYYLVKKDGRYTIAEGSEIGKQPEVFAADCDYLLGQKNKLYLIKDKSTTALDMNSGRTGKGTMYVTRYDKDLDAVLYIFVDDNTGEWGLVKRTLGSDKIRVYSTVDGAVKGEIKPEYFRHFFQTVLYSSIEGESKLTKEEREKFNALPDEKADLVMKVKTEDDTVVFRFFRYSERKTYFTINGYGNYYMISDRVDKLWNDALKVIAGEDVDATGKN